MRFRPSKRALGKLNEGHPDAHDSPAVPPSRYPSQNQWSHNTRVRASQHVWTYSIMQATTTHKNSRDNVPYMLTILVTPCHPCIVYAMIATYFTTWYFPFSATEGC